MFAGYFGEGVRPFTMVLVDEVVDGGWGRANETLTLEKMRAKKEAAVMRGCRVDTPCCRGDPPSAKG